jgi:hypothetical protein
VDKSDEKDLGLKRSNRRVNCTFSQQIYISPFVLGNTIDEFSFKVVLERIFPSLSITSKLPLTRCIIPTPSSFLKTHI